MSVTPYLGLAEVMAHKAVTAKGVVAEFVGTLLLVSYECLFSTPV